ncbi:hypothetical protein GBF38_022174, partial [Nibea albiflora]
PPKKRKQKRAEGFKVTWRKRDRNGNIISQHVRKNRSGTQFLCPACDSKVHKKHVFHDREAMIYGFFQPIPPTSSVMIDQSGQHQLAEQACVLPIPLPLQVCTCGTDQDFTIVPGKQTVLVTINGAADMITVLAMGWNRRKVESLHKTLAKRFVKTTQRADLEAANLLNLKQELNISQEDTEQWVEDVKQWAATERPGADSSQEELQREIDDMIYSLRRKKHDLYRQNDSNKTRQRKRRRITEGKKKLRERIMQYNDDAAFEEKIDIDAACSLLEDLILPWDVQGDVVSLRLKRRLFDQVMLVRRLEEERLIIVKEMTQHCHYLRKSLDKLDHLLHRMDEDIKNHMLSAEITEDGYRGLQCCLLHKRHLLQKKLSTVTSTYALVDASSSFTHPLDEGKEEGEEEEESEDDSSSDEE